MSKTVNPDKMSKFDRQYLSDRGIDPDEYAAKWQLDEDGNLVAREEPEGEDALANQAAEDDPALQPVGDPEDGDTNPESDGSEDDDYSTWEAKALQVEIARRNESRDEDSLIVPEGTGKEGRLRKADLVKALELDDNAEGDDETDA